MPWSSSGFPLDVGRVCLSLERSKMELLVATPAVFCVLLVLVVVVLLLQGDTLDTGRVLQALCNAVISSSVDEDEDPHALKLLAELLAEDGVDPNAGDEALWDNVRRRYFCLP